MKRAATIESAKRPFRSDKMNHRSDGDNLNNLKMEISDTKETGLWTIERKRMVNEKWEEDCHHFAARPGPIPTRGLAIVIIPTGSVRKTMIVVDGSGVEPYCGVRYFG